MNKQNHSLDYIKRQAKKLKKERSISHTQALELLAKENDYSNWKHCQRSLSQHPVRNVKAAEKVVQLSFTDWLNKHKNRNSPLGDLATDVLRDKDWHLYKTLKEYRGYLSFKNASFGAMNTLDRAWKSYRAYVQRKSLPYPKKSNEKKSPVKKYDPRKIVYVSNVTPLHYAKRTTEKFNPGDAAWISWDGRKAIPVTIVEVGDSRYTFRIERPIKKAGNEHFLFLDEVRSTPELACINRVTS